MKNKNIILHQILCVLFYENVLMLVLVSYLMYKITYFHLNKLILTFKCFHQICQIPLIQIFNRLIVCHFENFKLITIFHNFSTLLIYELEKQFNSDSY